MQRWQRFKVALARAWAFVWSHRTKLTGYLGIIGFSVKAGLEMHQRLPMIVFCAAVAAIGHYNDQGRAP